MAPRVPAVRERVALPVKVSETTPPRPGQKVSFNVVPHVSTRPIEAGDRIRYGSMKRYVERRRRKPKGKPFVLEPAWCRMAALCAAIARMRALCDAFDHCVTLGRWQGDVADSGEYTNILRVLGECVSRPPQSIRTTPGLIARRSKGGPLEIIADSGTYTDLIGRQDIPDEMVRYIRKVEEALCLNTANGLIAVDERIKMFSDVLGFEIDAYVLEDSPCAISIGARTMDPDKSRAMGWYWPPQENPWFQLPDGTCIAFDAGERVPTRSSGVVATAEKLPKSALPGVPEEVADIPAPKPDEEAEDDDGKDEAGFEDDGVDEFLESSDLLEPGDPEPILEPPDPTTPGGKSLKEQASSVEHLMCHEPKNPYCWACRVGKLISQPALRHHPTEAGSEHPSEWCELVTADNIFPTGESVPTTGETTAFSILDVGTEWCDCYPAHQKSTDHAVGALLEFAGDQHPNAPGRIRSMYTDGSKEFEAAAEVLGVKDHPISTRLRHQSNSKIELLNRRIKEGSRTALYRAGFHQRWWPRAARHYCFARNIRLRKGDSSFHRRHKTGHFRGLRVPFGAAVRYRVASRKNYLGEFDVPAQEGLFLGWKLQPGSKWKWEYLVVDLKVFSDEGAWRDDYGCAHVIVVREVIFDDTQPPRFPLKEAYDKAVGSVVCPPSVVQEAEVLGQAPFAREAPRAAGSSVDPPPNRAPQWKQANHLVQRRELVCKRFLTLEDQRDARWPFIIRRVTKDPEGMVL